MVYPFPNALNTGVRVGGVITLAPSLPTYSGANPITVNGTTVSGKSFTSALTIHANNVTITDCYFPLGGNNANPACIGVDPGFSGTLIT